MNATMLDAALRLLGAALRHPATTEVARHVLRVASQELIRHVRRRARARSTAAF